VLDWLFTYTCQEFCEEYSTGVLIYKLINPFLWYSTHPAERDVCTKGSVFFTSNLLRYCTTVCRSFCWYYNHNHKHLSISHTFPSFLCYIQIFCDTLVRFLNTSVKGSSLANQAFYYYSYKYSSIHLVCWSSKSATTLLRSAANRLKYCFPYSLTQTQAQAQ
jgi:hypothetical protein